MQKTKPATMSAFVRNRTMFLYLNKSQVRLNLVTLELHSLGEGIDVTDLKIQACAIKSWLLDDRMTFEMILKPSASQPPDEKVDPRHTCDTVPPPPLEKPIASVGALRQGLNAMITDLLSKRKKGAAS